MNVVDSSGWLEYFADGPNADLFAEAVEDTEDLLVPAIVIFEVHKRILQQRGEAEALQKSVFMEQARVIALDAALARNAAKMSCELKLPLADSIILATARAHNATLWTQDQDFKGIEGVKFYPARGS